MSCLSAIEMEREDAAGAEALVRTLGAGISKEHWDRITARTPPAGAIVLRGEDGTVFGFASYFPDRRGGEAILIVDTFVAAEPLGRRRCADMLDAALAERATALGCSGLGGPATSRSA